MSGSAPAGARGRGPRLAPNTPTRRMPWWSTVDRGRWGCALGRDADRHGHGHAGAGAGSHPDRGRGRRWHRRGSVRTARHAGAQSFGAVNGERCCGAPPTTPTRPNASSSPTPISCSWWWRLADPPPRTGLVERGADCRLYGRAVTDPVPYEIRPRAGRAVRRAIADLDPGSRHRGPATIPSTSWRRCSLNTITVLLGHSGVRQVDTGESPGSRSRSRHRRCIGGGQGTAHVVAVGGAAVALRRLGDRHARYPVIRAGSHRNPTTCCWHSPTWPRRSRLPARLRAYGPARRSGMRAGHADRPRSRPRRRGPTTARRPTRELTRRDCTK